MISFVKTAVLSMGCALCVVGFPDVTYGASSVRSLGGAGTYSGAASAAVAKTNSSANAIRAASLKAAAGTVSTGTSTVGSGSVRAASNPSTARLSIGSYLNSGRTISGGSSIKSQNPGSGGGTSGGGAPSADMQNQIDDLRTDVDALQDSDGNKYTMDETDALLNEKQSVLTAGDGIDITNGIISAVVIDGREVLLQSNDTHIQWKYDDATSVWENLIALSELMGPAGPQGSQGPQGVPGTAADLTDYLTSTEVNNAIITAITTVAGNYATAAQGAKADTALQSADLADYATVDSMNTVLATKANTDDLGALALKDTVGTDDIDNANVTKPKLATDVQASLTKADTALQPGDVPDALGGAPADGSDYVLVVNDNVKTWFKVAY